MNEHSMTKPEVGAKISAWVTGILLAAAAVAAVFGCSLVFRVEDTEPLESPLMLSVGRQLLRGPGELYGPFGRLNPLVIIHAPLYYRLAALGRLAALPRRARSHHRGPGGGPVAVVIGAGMDDRDGVLAGSL